MTIAQFLIRRNRLDLQAKLDEVQSILSEFAQQALYEKEDGLQDDSSKQVRDLLLQEIDSVYNDIENSIPSLHEMGMLAQETFDLQQRDIFSTSLEISGNMMNLDQSENNKDENGYLVNICSNQHLSIISQEIQNALSEYKDATQ